MPEYDYGEPGACFVTIVTQGHVCWFGAIVDDEVQLSAAGEMVERVWRELPERFPFVRLDAFVVMPNHVHGIIWLTNDDSDCRGESRIRPDHSGNLGQSGEHGTRPYGGREVRTDRVNDPPQPTGAKGTWAGSLGRVVQAFKSISTHEYTVGAKEEGWPRFPGRLWQRNYYEHVIRDEEDLLAIQQYIQENPLRWALDRENPEKWGG